MNKDRRKQIDQVKGQVEEAIAMLASARDAVEEIMGQEEEYLENMPESMQNGDKGQAAEEAIENLRTAMDNMDEVIDGDAVSSLENAAA